MQLFQSPPPTRFDLNFSLFGIPIRVHPLFWLIALLLGSSGGIIQILIWVPVVFVSILVHELGHALAFRFYGQRSHIVLHMTGGLTIPETVSWGTGWASVALNPTQEIFISLAGPFAGFLFAAFVMAGVIVSGGSILTSWLFGVIPLPLNPILPFGGSVLGSLIATLLWVNIFWGLINLMPVIPLDGGNVTRYTLLKIDPINGVRKSLWVSIVAGALVALAGLLLFGSLYMGFLFGFLAFQSYQMLSARYGGGF